MSFVIGKPVQESIPTGSGFVNIGDQIFYRIANVDALAPFFMNVVSPCDLWMYLSSRGGLTAGRVNAEQALFPYDSVDRIHDAHLHSGPLTACWVGGSAGGASYWQPFCEQRPGDAEVTRHLYKNLVGNQVVFEEVHEESQLVFRAKWSAADELGIVRCVEFFHRGDYPVQLSVLDGIRNILPWGIPNGVYQYASCLADAYKRTERDAETGLAIFAATAGISDGTRPWEVLRANVLWSVAPDGFQVGLAAENLGWFQQRQPVPTRQIQQLVAGKRGNYFVFSPELELEPGQSVAWQLVGDVGLGHEQLVTLREKLLHAEVNSTDIEDALERATADLVANVASADGLQQTGDRIASVHHFANVLYNNMRGGVFVDNYVMLAGQFREFVAKRNGEVAKHHARFLQSLPERCSLPALIERLESTGDPSLIRLGSELLPITFSRRHGDPSRPWNHFSIRVKDDAGEPSCNYEGNWRDIFQNWEGLCVSFPRFLESVVCKFLNGTTIDGFNPYRVTHDGLEWEQPQPNDPWHDNIGYWGDHQIIYLLKLLEALQDRQPRRLSQLLEEDRFAYLNVPYRLKPYAEMVQDANETISYDHALAKVLADRVSRLGEDGKLWHDGHGEIVHVNLTEKLLVPLLSKLSNFIVGGGIWMNTQRPEWNDANNALVGNGISLVTLCYLRRYLSFCGSLFESAEQDQLQVSGDVLRWLEEIQTALEKFQHRLSESEEISDVERRQLLDQLGDSFCAYRKQVYAHGLSERQSVSKQQLSAFCGLASQFADHTIHANYREDGLYHAYNVIDFRGQRLRVKHLYEMLEGQVAVLSSGALTPEQAADLLDVMFLSRLYRPDLNTFLLYPERQLADFLDRNVIPEQIADNVPLMSELIQAGDKTVVLQDGLGICRFNPDLRHDRDLRERLDLLWEKLEWREAVKRDRKRMLEAFESVFQHRSYTGRSGTMYGYEGLGCVYWHMVSKLLLAVLEVYRQAEDQAASAAVMQRLTDHYYRVRGGLGPDKQPEEFGAFPTDPYSHTPGHGGARQPGMTGQVKEEILTRFGELGVRVRQGRIQFSPTLLRPHEFNRHAQSFEYVNQAGQRCELTVPANSLAFTYCQVPIVLVADGQAKVIVNRHDQSTVEFDELQLDEATSRQIFDRAGSIDSIEVQLGDAALS